MSVGAWVNGIIEIRGEIEPVLLWEAAVQTGDELESQVLRKGETYWIGAIFLKFLASWRSLNKDFCVDLNSQLQNIPFEGTVLLSESLHKCRDVTLRSGLWYWGFNVSCCSVSYNKSHTDKAHTVFTEVVGVSAEEAGSLPIWIGNRIC